MAVVPDCLHWVELGVTAVVPDFLRWVELGATTAVPDCLCWVDEVGMAAVPDCPCTSITFGLLLSRLFHFHAFKQIQFILKT